MYLGIDIGNSQLKFCVIDAGGDISASKSVPLTGARYQLIEDTRSWDGPSILGNLGRAAQEFCAINGIVTSSISHLCISATAPDFWWMCSPQGSPSTAAAIDVAEATPLGEAELEHLRSDTGADTIWDLEFLIRARALAPKLSQSSDLLHYQTKHSWLFGELTGEYALDFPTAAELGIAFDISTGRWRHELISEYLGSPVALPGVVRAGSLSAKIRDEYLSAFALRPGARAVLGSCDSFCSMIGAGCLDDDDVFVYYGTYFCAANTWIGRHLQSDELVKPAFEWKQSLPFAGRVVENAVRALYRGGAGEAFEAFERSVRAKDGGSCKLEASISEAARPRLIWESVEFTLNRFGSDISRHTLVTALMRAIGHDLHLALLRERMTGNIYAGGGGTQSNVWISTVSEAIGRGQRLVPMRDEGIGTAFLAYYSDVPASALAALEKRRGIYETR